MFEATSPGDIASFSIRDGYLDAIVRGMQLGLLGKADYDNLTQCDSLDGVFDWRAHLLITTDMKLQLQSTTYGDFLVNEPSPLHTTTVAEKCTQKMVEDFEYLRTNSTYPLSKFLDYITYVFHILFDQSLILYRYGYMIDNVVLLITGTLHKRDVQELKEKCHPLGLFETMESITVGQSVSDLYLEVLIDTPLGMVLLFFVSLFSAPYIKDHLSEADLNEMDIELIRNTLYKAYLEDFDDFCLNTLGGVTGEVMHEILQVCSLLCQILSHSSSRLTEEASTLP